MVKTESYKDVSINGSEGPHTQECHLVNADGTGPALGGVDHMMKRKLSTLVNYYVRRIKREGWTGTFDVVVTLSENAFPGMSGGQVWEKRVRISA